MGNTEMKREADNHPSHEVAIHTFGISKTPITVAQYREYCRATGIAMSAPPSLGWIDSTPITNVSWQDAVGYTDWLANKTGKHYRLPTEAEWEYAARGGNQSKGSLYAGSNSLDSVGWYRDNSPGKPYLVAQKGPNELGIYDMSGNVWEWCSDWYGADYYANSPKDNPRGPASGTYRVLRGGSWFNTPDYCQVAFRYYYDPSDHNDYTGFRVVLVP